MFAKRKVSDVETSDTEREVLKITPLGAGQEVGRSCIMLDFKGVKIMLDCGVHPGCSGYETLPYMDLIEPEEVDFILITHFHLDHCGALPWFLQKTKFKGRCFMTHATKAVYRYLLSDYIRTNGSSAGNQLFTENDLEESMSKIETINFHEEKYVCGVKFWPYHAGHVLGAAMFMIEIDNVKVLYTGDFSREEDRHLMAAEIPTVKPDIVITESTYGTQLHEKKEDRENRFTNKVKAIVSRGGRCLIPVFALGRAQELLLILDEYWKLNPEFHHIPIYYASGLGEKCMKIFQCYKDSMNDKIRKKMDKNNNPFIFQHISMLRGMAYFNDDGPCVIMATPGMLQNGISRQLFESWCTNPKNGVIVAGYSVEGTLARTILSDPEEITTMAGKTLPLNMSVDYISFSAHTDYQQTSEFLRLLKPPHIVLVHGEKNNMARLKHALEGKFKDDCEFTTQLYNPQNTETVTIHFSSDKRVKVVGSLAMEKPQAGSILSGVLVKQGFNYQLMAPNDLPKFTDISITKLLQRLTVPYSGSIHVLKSMIAQIDGSMEIIEGEEEKWRVFNSIEISVENEIVLLEWDSSPLHDTYADAIIAAIMESASIDVVVEDAPPDSSFDKAEFKNCLSIMLQDMFGPESVGITSDDKLGVVVNEHFAEINVTNMEVICLTDDKFQRLIQSNVSRLYHTLSSVSMFCH